MSEDKDTTSREEERKARKKAAAKAYNEANRARNNAKSKKYAASHKEEIRARKKAAYKANREKIAVDRKVYYEANKEKQKADAKAYYHLNREAQQARRYGLTLVHFRAMMAAQGNRCKCCGTLFGMLRSTRPNIDHCHATGQVRGILCLQCNLLLGHAEDKPAILETCAQYLKATASAPRREASG
jgi:hypothetical protein